MKKRAKEPTIDSLLKDARKQLRQWSKASWPPKHVEGWVAILAYRKGIIDGLKLAKKLK